MADNRPQAARTRHLRRRPHTPRVPPIARRIIYKVKGPDAPTNFPLSAQQRAELDAVSLEQLLAGFRAQGDTFARGSSAYRGVGWHKTSNAWRAQIGACGGKQITLGYFSSEEEAARAYDAAAIKLHGRCAMGPLLLLCGMAAE